MAEVNMNLNVNVDPNVNPNVNVHANVDENFKADVNYPNLENVNIAYPSPEVHGQVNTDFHTPNYQPQPLVNVNVKQSTTANIQYTNQPNTSQQPLVVIDRSSSSSDN